METGSRLFIVDNVSIDLSVTATPLGSIAGGPTVTGSSDYKTYMMYKGTNTYHINSCETIEIFYNLRTDLDKLKYAIHINKIIQDITEENENCYKILQLFLNTLYTISETEKDRFC